MEGIFKYLLKNIEGIAAIVAIGIAIWTLKVSVKDTKKNQLMEIFMNLIELMNVEKEKIEQFNNDIILREKNKNSNEKIYTTIYKVKNFTNSFFYPNKDIEEVITALKDVSKQDFSLEDLVKDYKRNYKEFGSYFKIVHRIIKILNTELDNKIINENEYKNYVGILRSQFQNDDFLFILFNALISPRGTGMAFELIGSGFFGTENDIEIKQHFIFEDKVLVKKQKLKDLLIFFTYEYRDNHLNIAETRRKVRAQYERDAARIIKENRDSSSRTYEIKETKVKIKKNKPKSFLDYINFINDLED